MNDSKKMSWFEWSRENTGPQHAPEKPEALSDLLVLDLSHESMSGLVCSSILAEMGARVIRIEPPQGDPARRFSPFGVLHQDTGLGYLVEGRNKYHITLNIEDPKGRKIFKSLAKRADIVIETFQPGFMDGLEIGYRQLKEMNERLNMPACPPTATSDLWPRSGGPVRKSPTRRTRALYRSMANRRGISNPNTGSPQR